MRSIGYLRIGLCSLALLVQAGSAQVLEIGADGATKTFAGSMQYSDSGEVALTVGDSARRAAATAQPNAEAITRAAQMSHLSDKLIAAVAWQESRYHQGVVSRAGAIGEMQLMPATARALAVDPFDSEQNYRGGAAYLAGLLKRFDGDLVLSLAAYNAGPKAVERYRGVPPYKETRDYISAVLNRLSDTSALSTTRRFSP